MIISCWQPIALLAFAWVEGSQSDQKAEAGLDAELRMPCQQHAVLMIRLFNHDDVACTCTESDGFSVAHMVANSPANLNRVVTGSLAAR